MFLKSKQMRGHMPADDRPCRVVLVRHAVAEGQGRFLGQRDAPLSVKGRRQLPGLVAKIAKYHIDAVYSSDLRRAHSTARAIARSTQLPVEVRSGLREMHFGRWEGLSWQGISRTTPRAARSWLEQFPKHRAPGGEAFAAFKQRALREVNHIVSTNRGRCVVVVSHAGVTRIALARALGMPDGHLFRLAQDPCAINVIDYFRDGVAVSLVNG
jgi:alpha-ribazole phosphatase